MLDIKLACRGLFGVEVTDGQAEIIRTIAFSEHKRVVISAHTRYGKSMSVALGVCIYMCINDNKKINIIAPQIDQANIIRNYIASFVIKCPYLSEQLDLSAMGVDRIKKEVSKTRWTFKDGTELRIFSAAGTGDRLLGWGGDLIVVDESALVNVDVYKEKISRMLGDSPDSILVEIGNPWHRDNQMYQHWIDPNFKKIHVPYQIGLKENRITQSFIDEQKIEMNGEDSLMFRVLYGAEFPEESEDQLIKFQWIQNAINRKIDSENKPEIIIGCDIAEMGRDLTVCTVCLYDPIETMFQVIDIQSWGKTDLMPTVGRITELAKKYNANTILVDAIGVGAGVASRLAELKLSKQLTADVIPIKVGMAPSEKFKERFLNQKAELYWRLREMFEQGKLSILNHKDLISQLTKIKYELTSAAKIIIRDPEDKSPDFSDSLMLAISVQKKANQIYRPFTGR